MKTLAVILFLISATLAHAQCSFQLSIAPPSADSIAAERQVGQIIQHAGDASVFTNVVFLANGTTNWTSNLIYPMGLHQFRCMATNELGLVSAPGVVTQTNIVWAPTAVATVRISKTITVKVQVQ